MSKTYDWAKNKKEACKCISFFLFYHGLVETCQNFFCITYVVVVIIFIIICGSCFFLLNNNKLFFFKKNFILHFHTCSVCILYTKDISLIRKYSMLCLYIFIIIIIKQMHVSCCVPISCSIWYMEWIYVVNMVLYLGSACMVETSKISLF